MIKKICPIKIFKQLNILGYISKKRYPNTLLGRWGYCNSKKKLDARVNWTIEDHCGVCKELLNKKIKKK